MFRSLRRFSSDRSANFAMIAAVAALPLTMAAGLSVDVATVAETHTLLQQALEMAALGVAREGTALPDAEAILTAGNLVSSNYPRPFSNLTVTRSGTSVRVEAETIADTAFGSLLGYRSWTVKEVATADIAYVPYEIALVLDTTGSMNDNGGGKLRSMKDAVVKLIDTMSKDIRDKKNLKFAVVPFAAFVNVGPQYAPSFDKQGRVVKGTGASWLDVSGRSPIPQLDLKKGISRFEVFHNLGEDWAGCVETRQAKGKSAYDVADIAASNRPDSLFVPAFSMDEPDEGGYRNSYIRSPADPLDGTAENAVRKLNKYGLFGELGGAVSEATPIELHPVAADITASRGPNAGCNVKPIVPLSSDYASLKTQVQALVASGNTNITEGVAWGWRVLSPGEPFTEGAPRTSRVKKIVILLTDGSNTFGVRDNKLGSVYSAFGFAADNRLLPVAGITEEKANAAMNAKTLAACTNAKADGIDLYTIRLEEPNKTTGMMLKECASDADHFFDAPSHSQLDEVFGKIRDKIVSVRVTS